MQYIADYYTSIEQDRKALNVKSAEADPKPRAEQPRRADTRRDDPDDEEERNPAPSFFDIFKRRKKPQNNDGDFEE